MHYRAHVCQARMLHYWVHGQSPRRMTSLTLQHSVNYGGKPAASRRSGIPSSSYATVSSANLPQDGRISENLAEEDLPPPESLKYPYPMHKQPTPHEIFHLRHSASPAEIKARCVYTISYSPRYWTDSD